MSDATKRDAGAAKSAELKVSDLSRLRPRQRIALVRGQDSSRWTDIYHQALMQPWSVFLIGLLGVFIGINFIFALFYVADPHAIAGARPGSFWDAFLFSIQSVGSNNYSTMTPKTAYAHAVVVVETFTVNYAFLGLVMSLMFARFSRPFARIVFSKVALITPFDGTPTLMFRAANQRGNSVLDAEATVSVARRRVTREGIVMRRFEELKLVRCRTSLFALSWTIMHTIDETSPLYDLTPDAVENNEIEILVMLSGVDDTLADRIYARYTYTPDDIVWGARFVDVLSFTPHGRRVVDLNRFHDTEDLG